MGCDIRSPAPGTALPQLALAQGCGICCDGVPTSPQPPEDGSSHLLLQPGGTRGITGCSVRVLGPGLCSVGCDSTHCSWRARCRVCTGVAPQHQTSAGMWFCARLPGRSWLGHAEEQPGAFSSRGPAQEGHQGTRAVALPRQPILTLLQSSVRRQTAVPGSHPVLKASRHEGVRKREGVVRRDTEQSAVPPRLNSILREGRSIFRNSSISLSRLSLMAATPKTSIIFTLFSQLVAVVSQPICWENQAAK